jgi:cephalosporin hydroxylase
MKMATSVKSRPGARGRPQMDKRVASFHRLYFEQDTYWSKTLWQGVPCIKSPLDMWVYQEIVHETKPTLIVETGTYLGGSALYFASLLDLQGEGQVVTIDIAEIQPGYPAHPRITYLSGSSVDPAIVSQIPEAERVMVVLDSDHSADHVLAELEAYGPLVSPGCYLVVEDTCVGGRPLRPDIKPGPAEAVAEFLPGSDFEVDRSREKFLMTFNPGGFLRKQG